MALTRWYLQIHTAKKFRLGQEKKDVSGARFVYGSGVASLALGDFVTFNSGSYAPVRLVDTPLTGLVAISASANTSTTNFSWYMVYGASAQVSGLAGLVNITTTSTDKAAMSQSSTAGRATGGGVVATKTIVGAFAVGVSVANLGNAFINYPVCAGGSLA